MFICVLHWSPNTRNLMLQKGREAKKVILFFETQNFLINSFNCRFLSSIAQKADRKNWSPATRQQKLEKSRIAKKVHFQFCAFLFFDLNKCVTFYRPIKKKRAVRVRLQLWPSTGCTMTAPTSSSTTRTTATIKGTRDTLSPMPSGECARAIAQAVTPPLTFHLGDTSRLKKTRQLQELRCAKTSKLCAMAPASVPSLAPISSRRESRATRCHSTEWTAVAKTTFPTTCRCASPSVTPPLPPPSHPLSHPHTDRSPRWRPTCCSATRRSRVWPT